MRGIRISMRSRLFKVDDKMKKPIVEKHPNAGNGPDGKPVDVIQTTFVGCDGREYRILIAGGVLYVNDAKMQSRKDRPCEYTGVCSGIMYEESCSAEACNLDNPEERCGLYTHLREMDIIFGPTEKE